MSSFIGHSLAAATVQLATGRRNNGHSWQLKDYGWLGWLIIVSCTPDIDYVIKALRLRIDGETVRVTHSFAIALLLPTTTVIGLWLFRKITGHHGVRSLPLATVQLLIAGLSHLALDLSTGVSSLPLLYPFSDSIFKLPFGLLPSAGRLRFNNYYLYRNLFIELGVLIPLSITILLSLQRRLSRLQLWAIGLSMIIAVGFMTWALNLSR